MVTPTADDVLPFATLSAREFCIDHVIPRKDDALQWPLYDTLRATITEVLDARGNAGVGTARRLECLQTLAAALTDHLRPAQRVDGVSTTILMLPTVRRLLEYFFTDDYLQRLYRAWLDDTTFDAEVRFNLRRNVTLAFIGNGATYGYRDEDNIATTCEGTFRFVTPFNCAYWVLQE
jgi:hypothetical protein